MHAHVFSLIGVCQWSTGYHVTKISTFMVRPATTKWGNEILERGVKTIFSFLIYTCIKLVVK